MILEELSEKEKFELRKSEREKAMFFSLNKKHNENLELFRELANDCYREAVTKGKHGVLALETAIRLFEERKPKKEEKK
jgi:hypothetical protein